VAAGYLPQGLMSGVAREGARSLHTLTKPEGARHLRPLSGAVRTALYLLLVLALSIVRDASAQSILLGTSQTSGALVGYGISQKGTTVTVEPVGQIVASGKVGHLFGNFLGGADKELLQVRKIRNDTFAFIATKPDGTRTTRRVRLAHDVGDLFYLLTAFDTNGNGIHGIAIIDVSEHHYRWHIIEDPLSSSMRVERPFRLGFHGERIDWVSSPNGEVEFVALRQTINTRRTRALLRNANTGVTRVFRSTWDSPSGLLIPVRLQAGPKRDPGVALYAPANKEILLFDDKGGFEVFALPGQRCAGYQAVTNLSRSGAVSTIEVCSDGSYLVVQRQEDQRGEPGQESIIGSGTLPEALGNLRRGDATVVQETIGEISIPIVAPGSSGAEVLQPITQPGTPSPPATSTPKPQPTATAAPTDTPSNTPTPTPTVTPPSRFPMVGGATLLKDINDTITGNDSAYTKDLVPLVNGNLVFVAMNPEFGEEVWVTNGTLEGTQVLDSVNTMSSSYPVSGIGLSINPAGTRVYYACF
jgi:ELWxxDGT repeat protein